jgi:hypothetical protein
MENAPQNPIPGRDWRSPLVLGLSIGLGLGVARAVGSALEPGVGYWWAFAIRLLVAGAVTGGVSLAVNWLFERAGGDRA